MSQTAEILTASRPSYMRVVGVVSAAHFVSHYYIILLAPLMPFVRADYGVSYTEIGLAFAAFNIVSAVGQTPAGFLVDRIGARALLVAGLADRRCGLHHRGPCRFVLGDGRDVRRSQASATRSITRPTMRCSRNTCRPIASVRRSRCTLLPACSVRPSRRRACSSCRANGAGAARSSARQSSVSPWRQFCSRFAIPPSVQSKSAAARSGSDNAAPDGGC